MKSKSEWRDFANPYFLCEWCGRYYRDREMPVAKLPVGVRCSGSGACIECCKCPHCEVEP